MALDGWASLRGGRLRRPVIAFASVLLAAAVLGFLVAPPILRPLVEEQASVALGRKVSLGALRLNPFSLSVTLRDLHLAEAEGEEDFLRIDELYANFEASSLFRRAPVVREIRLRKPQLHIVREAAGRYNFSDLVERFATPAKDQTRNEAPARFALYNIRVQDGDIRVEDKLEGQSHRVASLQIGLPFLSNLPDKLEVEVTPELRATFNGSAFALAGEVKPFADHREADLRLKLDGLDLLRYLDYVPGKLPVAVQQGRLSADLRLLWSEALDAAHSLSVEGSLSLDKLRVDTPQKEALLQVTGIRLDIAKLEPLAQPLRADLTRLELVAPQLSMSRDAEGQLNLARLFAGAGDAGAARETPRKNGAKAGATAPPQLTLGELVLREGRVAWRDAAVPGGFSGTFKDIGINLKNFDLAGQRAAPLKLALASEGRGGFSLDGTLHGVRQADLQAGVDALPLGRYIAYLRQVLQRGELEGTLDAKAHVMFRQTEAGPEIALDHGQAKLSELQLTDPDETRPFMQVSRLEVGELSVDPQAQLVKLGSLRTEGGKLKLVRDAKGRFRLLRLILKEEAKDAVQEAASEVKTREWGLALTEGALSEWDVALEDQGVSPPVRMQLRGIKLGVSGLSNLDRSLGKFQLSSAVNAKGAIQVDGQLGLGPLRGELAIDMRAVDVLIAQPYVDDMWRVLITRGQLFAKGRGQFESSVNGPPRFNYRGELALRDFNSLDTLNDTDFLRWKDLSVKGVDFQLQPLQVTIKDASLDSFYTRLILDQEGRFNLRELRLRDTPSASGPVAAQPASGKASGVVSPPPAPDYSLRVDRIAFTQGDVNYSDRFIKPNYDAHLLRVQGGVTGLSTDQNGLARLDLQAALDGNAPVRVGGEFNPFRSDRYLDVKAQVSDVDLTGVSAYSTKYVGYGITRGKLSMKLDYQIRERKLTAQNQVFLDQLTFGERAESPSVFDFPVKLGVALLKDSRGQIDLNLPINGSLDDPEFSMGGVIWRVIGNLFAKVVTSPFALLGSVFGGGDNEELAFVDFEPGRDLPDAAGLEKLKTLAKSLLDRPALRLDVTGRADPAADVVGLKQLRLEARLRALKAERLVKRGESVASVDALEIAAAERGELLWDLYKREPFEKPRNAIGMVRELPAAELEQALLKHGEVTAEDLRALASRRAGAVRDWFVTTGGVPSERVFLLTAEHDDKTKQAPRVDFGLR